MNPIFFGFFSFSFSFFVFACQTTPGLPELLRLPVSRLPVYIAFLERAAACTPDTHAASKSMHAVLAQLRKHQAAIAQVIAALGS